MKSTYKLLGVFRDNMPCKNNNPRILRKPPREHAKHILLSQLLSSQSIGDIEWLLAQNEHNNFSVVIVEVDYVPKCDNKTVTAFFSKRIRQISTYLNLHFNDVFFVKSDIVVRKKNRQMLPTPDGKFCRYEYP